MMAIDEAQRSGARFSACCECIKIGQRTIQRWRRDLDAKDMRMGPKTEPKNKLYKLNIRNIQENGVTKRLSGSGFRGRTSAAPASGLRTRS